MSRSPRTRLIWTVTPSELSRVDDSPKAMAQLIHRHGIAAIRMTCSTNFYEKISKLRKEISFSFSPENVAWKNILPGEGKVPFLLSLVGRRAVLSVPQGSLHVTDGETLQVTFLVDYAFCASGSMRDALSQHLEIRVSSADQLVSLKEDSRMSISYGAVTLVVTQVLEQGKGILRANCTVQAGGDLISGMDVHSSDMSRDLFPLLPEDAETLRTGFANLADYVVIDGVKNEDEFFTIKKSFVGENDKTSERHPSIPITSDIRLAEATLSPRFLLKVDSKRSLDLLPTLIRHVDGVFLSRSELGIDEHPHNLPILQKKLVSQCNQLSKMVIIASELMHSMRINANPTRAEVSDMANAAADGADALVLSHEITCGPNAELVAAVSQETLLSSEAWFEKKWRPFEMESIPSEDDAVTYGAIRIAEQVGARAIVCFTEGGYTAMKLSAMRTPVEIIALTLNKKIMRQMNLLRSVTSILLEHHKPMESILEEIKHILQEVFGFEKGDLFVFVSLTASSVAKRNSNIFAVQKID